MRMVHYRYYEPGDEAGIAGLWNESLPYDPISAERFRNQVLLDPNFDPEGMRVAVADGELAGCVYAVRRQLPMHGTDLESDSGWISFFFVHESFRRVGIGSRLMDEALDFLKRRGRNSVFFSSYAPNYFLPGLDEKAYPSGYRFLLEKGFSIQYSPVAMDRSLVGLARDESIGSLKRMRESEGFVFREAEDRDLYEVIRFANEAFNPDWGRAIREGLLRGMPRERILVSRCGGRIAGFCLYGGYEGIPERFGPFGVDPAFQGKGLGKILLHDCLLRMRAEGLHNAWFLWTGERTAAGHLYTRHNFTITRRFHVMKKDI